MFRARLVVDIDSGAPIALQDIARHMREHRDRGAANVDTVDATLVEVPGHDGIAGAGIGIFTDPAGAKDAAIADFEQSAFQMIRHGLTPFLV